MGDDEPPQHEHDRRGQPPPRHRRTPFHWRTVLAFALITCPLLILAAVLGGWIAAMLAGLAVALVAAALLDPG